MKKKPYEEREGSVLDDIFYETLDEKIAREAQEMSGRVWRNTFSLTPPLVDDAKGNK